MINHREGRSDETIKLLSAGDQPLVEETVFVFRGGNFRLAFNLRTRIPRRESSPMRAQLCVLSFDHRRAQNLPSYAFQPSRRTSALSSRA
jgi:hypothetical protein